MSRPHVLVTGANGFVGSTLCSYLEQKRISFIGAVRKGTAPGRLEIGNINENTDWTAALNGCDAVIHLAARVHVMDDKASDPLLAFRAMNVDATLNLARQAANMGVKRFVFVSSIKVNGEGTTGRLPYASTDAPAPSDAYGLSKSEAETALFALSRATGLEVVVIRPPLVYGPGVGANFFRLMQLVKSGIPLPLGSVHNQRSLVSAVNLVDLLVTCIDHPAAAGEIFLVSDHQDVSTPDLLRMLAASMGKRAWLLPVSEKLLWSVAAMSGKSLAAERLLGSLQVDIEHTRSTLGWNPVVEMRKSIDRTVAHFLSQYSS